MHGLKDISFEWAMVINHDGENQVINFISCFVKNPIESLKGDENDLAITVVMDNWSGNLVSIMGSDAVDDRDVFYQIQNVYGISKEIVGQKKEKCHVIYCNFGANDESKTSDVKRRGKVIKAEFRSGK